MKRLIMFFIYILAFIYPIDMMATNRALVIGLGEQEDKSWRKIHGDNDVVLVVQFLKDNGFNDIRTLKNQQATKNAIVDSFVKLANDSKPGDFIYIHYSGHGQLMTDTNGDESARTNSTKNLWDQSWIPYDAYMSYCENDHGEHHLCDDEIGTLLRSIRKAVGNRGKIVVVVDSCHSGDATCGNDEYIRGVSDRFIIPSKQITSIKTKQNPQWLTISACQSYQLSTEIKVRNFNYGKLTYALYRLGLMSIINNGDLESKLSLFMNSLVGRKQDPAVTGHI